MAQCYVVAALRQEALKVDETSPWVLDINDVYYNIALVGTEHICTNLKNDIMVSCRSCDVTGVIFIVSSDKLLVMMEKLVKQLFSVAGRYRGLPVAMLYIGRSLCQRIMTH